MVPSAGPMPTVSSLQNKQRQWEQQTETKPRYTNARMGEECASA